MYFRSTLFKSSLPFFFNALLLLAAAGVHQANAQTVAEFLKPNPAVESWIRQQVQNGWDANAASAFPNEADRVVSSTFLEALLSNPPRKSKTGQTVIWIADVTVDGDLNFKYQQVPYALYLKDCQFLNRVNFAESKFGRSFSLEGSTFESSVNLYGLEVSGNFLANECQFKNRRNDPAQSVSAEYMKIGRDLSIEGAEFDENVSFLRSHISQIFAAENAKFLNKGGQATFEDIKVDGALQIRKSQFECEVNFLSATTGVFDANNVNFNGPAHFWRMTVNGDLLLNGSVFRDDVHFSGAEVKKNFELHAAFTNLNTVVQFYNMKIGGNAIFDDVWFAGGLVLARTTIDGNLVLRSVTAMSGAHKDFSVVKADNLILYNNWFAPPYSLNGMSYRLLFAPPDQLLRFVDGADYDASKSNVYKNLESFYLQQGNIDGAKDVHIAWKKRERAALGPCTLCFNRNSRLLAHPFQYLWDWIQYLSTGYGQHLELALLWSIGFIVAGYFVFRRENWMDPSPPKSDTKATPKYSPWWYSIALFLPVVNLKDKDNWTPKANRRKSRIYMRFHIIFGYLLIPIGLAAWTGIIK